MARTKQKSVSVIDRPLTFYKEEARIVKIVGGDIVLIELDKDINLYDKIAFETDNGLFNDVGYLKSIKKVRGGKLTYHTSNGGVFPDSKCYKIIADSKQIAKQEIVTSEGRYHIDMDIFDIRSILDKGGYCDVEMEWDAIHSHDGDLVTSTIHLYAVKLVSNKVIIHK